MAAASVRLKIDIFGEPPYWSDLQASKHVDVDPSKTIEEFKAQIKEVAHLGTPSFGLFMPAGVNGPGCWLNDDKTIFHYQLRTGQSLEYRLKIRPLRVDILGLTKTIPVDESLSITEVVKVISAKENVNNPEEYGLKPEGEEDSNVSWLPPTSTLHECGISGQDKVVYQKKLFFYDSFIDESDEMSLALLYRQVIDLVLSGQLSLHTEEIAVKAAALALQITFGDQTEQTGEGSGFLDDGGLEAVLPDEWASKRGIVNKIYRQHATLSGLPVRKCEDQYVKLIRSANSKMYGVALFEVQQKVMQGLFHKTATAVPRLLGIGRDSVMIMDVKARTILQEQSYVELRRHDSGGNAMTMDFGQYCDSLLTFMTPNADQIVFYLRAYLDLHRRQKFGTSRHEVPGGGSYDDDTVGPTGPSGPGGNTPLVIPKPRKPGPLDPNAPAPPPHVDTVAEVTKVLKTAKPREPPPPPPLPEREEARLDMIAQAETAKRKEAAKASLACGNLVLSAMDSDGFNPDNLLDAAISLNSALDNLIGQNVTVGALSGDESHANDNEVLEAQVKKMIDQASLCALQLEAGNFDMSAMEDLLAVAKDVGDALRRMVGLSLDDVDDIDPLYDDLLAAAEALNFALSSLVGEFGSDPRAKDQVKAIQLLTGQLDAIATNASASLKDPEVLKLVNNQVAALRLALGGLTDDCGDLAGLLDVANDLSEALNGMVGAIAQIGEPPDRSAEIEAKSKNVKAGVVALQALVEDKPKKSKLISATKSLMKDTVELSLLAELEARGIDQLPVQESLLDAARALSEALARLRDDSAALTKHTSDVEKQRAVSQRATELGAAVSELQLVRSRIGALLALTNVCQVVAGATESVKAEVDDELEEIRVQVRQEELRSAVEACMESNNAVLMASRVFSSKPMEPAYQGALLSTAAMSIRKYKGLVGAAKAAAPLIDDATFLTEANDQLEDATAKLARAVVLARRVCWDLDVEKALSGLLAAQRDADAGLAALADKTLTADDGVTQQSAQDNLVDFTEALVRATTEAVAAVKHDQAEDVGAAAIAASAQSAYLVSAAKDIAATTKSPDNQAAILANSKALAVVTAGLLKACKKEMLHPSAAGDAAYDDLNHAAEAVEDTVRVLLTSLPGQGDCDHAVEAIRSAAEHLDASTIAASGESGSPEAFETAAESLTTAARTLGAAVNHLHAAANSSPDDLGDAARAIEALASQLFDAVEEAAGATTVPAARSSMVGTAKGVADATIAALQAAKAVGGDNDDTEAPKRLSSAAGEVSDAIAVLLTALKSGEPSAGDAMSADCDRAVGLITEVADNLGSLASLSAGGSDAAFASASDKLLEAAKTVATQAAALGMAARSRDAAESTGPAALAVAAAVESTGEAAISAASSMPGAGGATPTVSAHEFKIAATKVMNGLAGLLQAEKKVSDDPEALRKAVAKVGRAAVALSNLAKESAKTLSGDNAVELKNGGDGLYEATTKLVKVTQDHIKTPSDAGLQNKFLGKAKKVAVVCDGLSTLAKNIASGSGSGSDGGVGAAQQGIIDAARAVATALAELVGAAKVAASDPSDDGGARLLASTTEPANAAIEALVAACKFAGPGQLECDHALATARGGVGVLNSAILGLSVGEFKISPSRDNGKNVAELLKSAKMLAHALAGLVEAASSAPGSLGVAANDVDHDVERTVRAALASASTVANPEVAATILHLSKDVVDEVAVVVDMSRAAGGNPAETEAIAAAGSGAQITAATIGQLVAFLETISQRGAECEAAATAILAAREVLVHPSLPVGHSFADYEKDLKSAAKKLVGAMAKIVEASRGEVDRIGESAAAAAAVFPALMTAVAGCVSATADPGLSDPLVQAAVSVVEASAAFVLAGRDCEIANGDSASRAHVQTASTEITRTITDLLRASKAAGSVVHATADAIRAIEEAVVELKTSDYMAANGQLTSSDGSSFHKKEKKVDSACKALAHDVSRIHSAYQASQAELDAAATEGASDLAAVVTTLITATTVLEDAGDQRDLLAAAQALADAMAKLIDAAQTAINSGLSSDKKKAAKSAAKNVAVAIAGLLEKAKAARENASIGDKALEDAAAKISGLLSDLNDGKVESLESDEEGLMAGARGVNAAATKLYFAANKPQATIAERATEAADSVGKLLSLTLGALGGAGDDVRDSLLAAARAVAEAVGALVGEMRSGGEGVAEASRAVGGTVATLQSVAGLLSNAELLNEDPNDAAERELNAAVASVEAAAQELLTLRPPEPKVNNASAQEVANFQGSVIEMCAKIAEFSTDLIRAATVAQKEIVLHGKEHDGPTYNADSAWSQGLISGAREVVAALEQLVYHAKAYLNGECEETYLVAAAQMVNSSNAHLVYAAKAKAYDLNSAPQKALAQAARNVKTATGKLVRAAAEVNDDVEDDDSDGEYDSVELSFKERLQQQEELNEAQRQLDEMRRNINKKVAPARATRSKVKA